MANNSATKATNITIYFQYQEIGYFTDSTALLHIILGRYIQHMFNFIRCTGDFNVCSYQRQNKLIILNCTLKTDTSIYSMIKPKRMVGHLDLFYASFK